MLDAEIAAFIARSDVRKPVLLVEGARQVGKSSLVDNALRSWPDALHLDLERDSLVRSRIDACRQFSDFEELLLDEHGFSGADERVLFVDEAQESRRLGGFVRFMKEEWTHATAILSGSTLTRLFRAGTRYPVGRVRRLVVRPFSFTEFLLAAGCDSLAEIVREGDLAALHPARHERLLRWYDRYLRTGGLPEVVLTSLRGEDHRELRARIGADYEQDFIRIFGEDRLPIVQAALRAVANFVGSPFKNTAVVSNPSTRTNERINEVLSRLESWHMLIRSNQLGPSGAASQRYLPKRYLFDTGLLRDLREAAVPPIDVLERAPHLRTLLGGALENQLAVDLLRHSETITGWKRASAAGEIDFVLRLGEREAVPVECKASLKADGRHLRGLRAYLNDHPARRGALVSFAPFQITRYADGKEVLWVPAYAAERLPELLR